MGIGKAQLIMVHAPAVANARKEHPSSLVEVARQECLAKKLVQHCLDRGGMRLAGKSEDDIQKAAAVIGSGIIWLSSAIGKPKVIVNILRTAIEVHHLSTAEHQTRVAGLCSSMAESLDIDPAVRPALNLAAQLHDIGKIIVPDPLLEKDGLEPEENDLVKRGHQLFGFYLLRAIPFLAEAAGIMGYIHILNGYAPRGFNIEKMPLEAQILSAADAYDARTNPRGYREGCFPRRIALEELWALGYNWRVLNALTTAPAGA